MNREGYKLLGIHSQSNRPDAPLQFEHDPAEQAYDSRVLCLPNLGVVAMSAGIEVAYANYFFNTLQQDTFDMVVPKGNGSLSKALIKDDTAIAQIKASQKKNGEPYVYSVFDPTQAEEDLLLKLIGNEVDLVPEINFALAEKIGSKVGFREFCQRTGIPQIEGGTFSEFFSLHQFVHKYNETGVVVKHPYGTAGEGLHVIPPHSLASDKWDTWKEWIQHAGTVTAEVFHPGKQEHSLHIYIDPLTKKAKITGMYDQLVTRTESGFAHYGCRYPMTDQVTAQTLEQLAKDTVIPALKAQGYTGPGCFDLKSNPFHFMEVNTRTGANMYAHRMVEKVAKALYGIDDPKQVGFMLLAGLKHDAKSFAEFAHKFKDALTPTEEGMVIFTNPGRHSFQSYDIIGMSPKGAQVAEKVLWNALVKMWGEQQAKAHFDKIYS